MALVDEADGDSDFYDDSMLDLVRTQGYAVMEGFLTADEVAGLADCGAPAGA